MDSRINLNVSVMPLTEIRRSQCLIKAEADVLTAMLNQQPAAGVLPLTFTPALLLLLGKSTVQRLKNYVLCKETFLQHGPKPQFLQIFTCSCP